MNGRGVLLAQAARGPVMMITIGVLFALHQAGVLSFGRTWPLILIVLGIMKLIERTAGPVQPPFPSAQQPPYQPPPPPYGRPPYPPAGGPNQ